MYRIEKLAECKGSGRFGTCSGCGKSSDADTEMIRVSIGRYEQWTSICLCKECSPALFERLLPVVMPGTGPFTISKVKKAIGKHIPKKVVFHDAGYHPHFENTYTASCPECGLPIFVYSDADIAEDCFSDDPEVKFKSNSVHHGYLGLNNFCNRCGQRLCWGSYPRIRKAIKSSKYVPDGDWIPVEKKLPETGEHVRLTCEIKFASGARKRYVCEGYHVGRHEMSATGTSWDDECVEYDEETDESFVAEGWYEVIHNWPEYAAAAISDFVVAWKPMDKPWDD